MGRLYQQIRKDIETLRRIDEAIKNNQLVGMDDVFALSIALKNIEYVITYTESEEPELLKHEMRFPAGELTHFNLPEEFEALVDGWEESLGEERTNHALNHLQRQSEAEPLIPEITPHNPTGYYDYVCGTLGDIASISQAGHFGISREGVVSMVTSAHQDFVKTIFAQDYAFDPRDNANREIYEFIDNPIEEIITPHRNALMLEDQMDRREFLRNGQEHHNSVVANSDHPRPFNEVTAYYPVAKALLPLHKAKWNVQDISTALQDSVTAYCNKYQGKKDEPTIGTFLSTARDRVEATLLDHAIQLGEDPNSKFLKDFLNNPVDAMESHYRDLANDTRKLQKVPGRIFAEKIHGEQEHYNQARVGKIDRFAQIEESKKERFQTIFHEWNPDFDPSTFKRLHQGSAFERYLHRTSREWIELSDYIDSWQQIGVTRDYDRATVLAENYLHHKFPGVDLKTITPEMCQGLRGAGKDRGLFCLSLVHGKTMAEDQVNQEVYDQANRRFDQLEARLHQGQNFQDRLAGDIEKESNNDQPVNDNEIVNDNVIENNVKL